jgi:hypothetical protein
MLLVAAFAIGYAARRQTRWRQWMSLGMSSLMFGFAYLAVPTAVFFFAAFVVYLAIYLARRSATRRRSLVAVGATLLVPFAE